jgi:CHAT domain-containing protein
MRIRARCAFIAMIASTSCTTSAALDTSYPVRQRVVTILEESRPFDVRLTVAQPYRSCVITDTARGGDEIRCATRPEQRLSTRTGAIAVEVAALLARQPTTDVLWGAALLDLWSPNANSAGIDRAISRLNEVAAREKGRFAATALNDVAIAYAVRASVHSDVGDLFAALDFAERAVAADSTLASARFNRAVLLEQLHLDTQAEKAWGALSSEKNGWGREAADRERRLAERAVDADASFGEPTLGDDALERRAAAEPQRAREYVLDSVVGLWASAASDHDAAKAASLRHRVDRIGYALAARSGDSSVLHIAADLNDDRHIVAAAPTGASGLSDYAHTRYVDAQPKLESAVRALRLGHASALSDWFELTLAGLHIYRGEYQIAERQFDGIIGRASTRHDVALEARARWGLSLSRARRGAMVDGESAYLESSRQFDAIGEASNSAFLKTIISEIHHALGREDASDRDLYGALAGFHLHPRPGQRYALLLVIGTRLSERGQRNAAAAMIREAVLEAEATGRAKDLPEALSRLAAAESNLGDPGAARLTIKRARELLAGVPDSVMRSRLDAEIARAEARVYRRDDPRLAVDRLDRVVSYFSAAHIPTDEAAVRVDRASLLLSLGDSAAAERDLASATAMAATYIGRNPTREASRLWLETQRDAFRALVSIALARGDTARAYEYTRQGARTVARTAASGSALLEYVVLDQKTLIWMTINGARTLSVAAIGDLALQDLATRLLNLTRQEGDRLAQLALSVRLDKLLIAPVRSRIAAANLHHLVIAPDAAVSRLPFAALRDAKGKYLIEDLSIAYSEDAGHDGRAGHGRSNVPVTDALFIGSPNWDRSLFPELEPLHAVDREVRASSALYPRHTTLSDSAASRAALMREMPRHAIVHFAGHARVVDDNPAASHLVLAKQPGGFNANVLFASDIATLPLSGVRLVVLSACGSPGARFRSAASNGLVEAFLDAGVENVIASDWEADDEGTAALTQAIHRELRSGAAPDEALRRAQVALLRNGDAHLASPSVWSGFRVSARDRG